MSAGLSAPLQEKSETSQQSCSANVLIDAGVAVPGENDVSSSQKLHQHPRPGENILSAIRVCADRGKNYMRK